MSILDTITEGVGSVLDNAMGFVKENPIATSIGATAVGVGSAVAISSVIGKATSKKRKTKTKRGRSRDRKFRSKQKHEKKYKRKRKYKVYGKKGYQYPKKRKSGTKKRTGKLYYTKKGQPYKILASGKARFVKKTKGGKK